MNFETPFLYPVLDDTRSVNLKQDALEIIRAGAKIFQIRAKRLTNREMFDVVQSILPHCIEPGVSLIVNDRVDVCLASRASGVHLGQDDFPVPETRKLLPDAIIGLSTHNLNQVTCSKRFTGGLHFNRTCFSNYLENESRSCCWNFILAASPIDDYQTNRLYWGNSSSDYS